MARKNKKKFYRGWLPVEDEFVDTDLEPRVQLEAAIFAITHQVANVKPTQEMHCADSLGTVLVKLVALNAYHQSAHWRSFGSNYYSDHQLFSRMYDDTSKEIDQVAERLLGTNGDESILQPNRLLNLASTSANELILTDEFAQSLLNAETKFILFMNSLIKSLEHSSQSSPGTLNMLQAIADKHEEHIYLLKRRTMK